MHTVASFDNAIYAHMFKNKLESEGIRCCVADAEFVTMKWTMANAVGGVKVQILDEDIERVRPIVEQMERIPGQFIFLPPKQVCPACGSSDIRRRPYSVMLGIALLGFPLLFGNRGFICNQCDHEFKHFAAEDVASESSS